MTPAEVVAILRVKGIDATLEDLAACPGSSDSPYPSVTLANGDLLSLGRTDDTWTETGAELGEHLHLQSGPGYDTSGEYPYPVYASDDDAYSPGRMRIWHDVNAREALSIMETFGRRR